MCRYAKLSESELSQVRKLEDKLGIYLLAVQKMPETAKLSDKQLAKLQNLEKELEVQLVAYK